MADTSNSKLDLVTIGNVSIDTIKIEGSRTYTRPGGSAAAVSTSAAACGLRTGIFSRVGRDFKKTWLNELRLHGVDTSGIITRKSSPRFELHYNSKGDLLNFNEIFNSEDNLTHSDIPSHYLRTQHIHLSAAHPKTQMKYLSYKSLKNATISVALWPAYESEYDGTFVKMLKNVHVLFCNNHEAKMLAHEDNIYDAVKKIKGPDVIVLTKGSKGSAIYHNGKFHLFPAPRTSTIDRTGCGDSFAGGFLAEYLQSGNVEKAGWTGVTTASFTLNKMGSWFPREVTQDKITQRISLAKNYSEMNVKKGTLLDFL
ncbi:MAG: carbohydrate kinase family protein [archaeon]